MLASGVARGAAGAALDAAVPWAAPGTEVRETVREVVAEGGIDVLVEVSNPEAALAQARDAVETGTAVVVGTSGLDGEDLAVLEQAARRKGQRCRRRRQLLPTGRRARASCAARVTHRH